jgi:hypothetical protein
MPIYLAGRRTYLRQFNQERWGFTSLRDRVRYARVGMWGPAEIEDWLGKDARYAVVESDLVRFYRNRPLYREALDRIDILLARNFTLLGKVDEGRATPSRSIGATRPVPTAIRTRCWR